MPPTAGRDWRSNARPPMAEQAGTPPATVTRALRRVGVVLALVGTVDVAWMIHAVASGSSYMTSYGVFAWIGGACLWRRNACAARIVAQAGAFLFTASIAAVLALPLLLPADLVRTSLAIAPPAEVAADVTLTGFMIWLPWWAYRALTRDDVRQVYASQETSRRKRPEAGFVAGAVLAAVGVAVALGIQHGARHDEAVRRASELRPGRAYFVSGLSSASGRRGRTKVRAIVLAYSENEIERLTIEWRE